MPSKLQTASLDTSTDGRRRLWLYVKRRSEWVGRHSLLIPFRVKFDARFHIGGGWVLRFIKRKVCKLELSREFHARRCVTGQAVARRRGSQWSLLMYPV